MLIESKVLNLNIIVPVEVGNVHAKVRCLVFIDGEKITNVDIDPDEVFDVHINERPLAENLNDWLLKKVFGMSYSQLLRKLAKEKFTFVVIKDLIDKSCFKQ